VIQHIYDAHYEGVEAVEAYARDWKSLRALVDERRFQEISSQLEYQAGQAQVWRDAVNNWFHRTSGIADARGRVGSHPGRVEAEAMRLESYKVVEPVRWEGASGGKAVGCESGTCAATFAYSGAPGWFTLRIQYFDQNNGASRYRVSINGQHIDQWTAAYWVPSARVDSSTSTRRTIAGVALRPGDSIRIEADADAGEAGAIDYVEIIN
jgi:alpha-glucuronidase